MTLYDVLKSHARRAAHSISLPLGWEGDVFTPPHTPHLRGRARFTGSTAATLGAGGLTRTDGSMELTLVVPAGNETLAANLAESLQRFFPRGTALDFTQGTVTLGTPSAAGMTGSGARLSVIVTIPFRAFSIT